MRKLFQKEWFGINFNEIGVELSSRKIAGVGFYKKFYQVFYQKFNGYEDLPKIWLSIKDEIIGHIDSLLETRREKILSIGCGNGYIEHSLLKNNININIVAIEPATYSIKWLDNKNVETLSGFFPVALKNKYKVVDFDLIYVSGIDYVFDDECYQSFLTSLNTYGVQNFLLTEILLPPNSVKSTIKHYLESILAILKLRDCGQFWGYLRTIDEHKRFLTKAGFNNFEVGQYQHGGYWIKCST